MPSNSRVEPAEKPAQRGVHGANDNAPDDTPGDRPWQEIGQRRGPGKPRRNAFGVGRGQAEVSRQARCHQAVARKPPTKTKNHQGRASGCRFCPPCSCCDLKISTAREGVIVMALIAEMIVETVIVTANC